MKYAGSGVAGRINWLVAFILIVYPIILASMAFVYLRNRQFGMFELSMLLMGHYCTNISVGVGLHRLWAHGAFKTSKWVEWFLALFTAGVLQGPALMWASDHQRHHAYTDTELDPHSPLKYKSRWLGFLWSHMGWMLIRSDFHIDTMTMRKLGKPGSPLLWQLKHYYKLAIFMNVVVPLVLGYLLTFSLQGAIAAYIFLGLGRAFQQHMTFCVNSLCHYLGARKYTDGTAGDIWWMFLLLLGENWHNFHHAFARDYRNGWKWYQFDVHKWIIYAMSKLGLAWDLIKTPVARIEAKEKEAQSRAISRLQANLKFIEAAAQRIADGARSYVLNAEKSAHEIAENVREKMKLLESSALNLALKVRSYAAEMNISDEIVMKANKKLRSIERLAESFGIVISGLK